MVGAGFSKNAQNNSFSSKSFPDWSQLGNAFYKKIYGDLPNDKDNKEKYYYLNPLKLANEVQAVLGRPALDKLLLNEIPDKTHEPSPLHAQLLNLPWVDVFTTNYDGVGSVKIWY